jgi:uncharacterized protein (TIGR02118 family)
MIRSICAFRRAPGLSRDELDGRWAQHAAAALAVPGVRGYEQALRVGEDAASTAPFDGYASLWFDDVDAARAAAASPQAAASAASAAAFVDASSMRQALTRELVQRDTPEAPGMVRLIFVFHRRPDLTPQAFRRHWLETHGPLAMQHIAGLRRYVQNHTADEEYADGEPAFDGWVEAWLDGMEALEATEASPEHAHVRDDEPNFLDVDRITFMPVVARRPRL